MWVNPESLLSLTSTTTVYSVFFFCCTRCVILLYKISKVKPQCTAMYIRMYNSSRQTFLVFIIFINNSLQRAFVKKRALEQDLLYKSCLRRLIHKLLFFISLFYQVLPASSIVLVTGYLSRRILGFAINYKRWSA